MTDENELRLSVGEARTVEGGNFEAVIIPQGCASIGPRAFANCSRLKYVKLPAGATHIAADAFEGCGTIQFDRAD